jgi:hypothetical protein
MRPALSTESSAVNPGNTRIVGLLSSPALPATPDTAQIGADYGSGQWLVKREGSRSKRRRLLVVLARFAHAVSLDLTQD